MFVVDCPVSHGGQGERHSSLPYAGAACEDTPALAPGWLPDVVPGRHERGIATRVNPVAPVGRVEQCS